MKIVYYIIDKNENKVLFKSTNKKALERHYAILLESYDNLQLEVERAL